ncbi:hypothetical protein [Saccharothrix sp. HUAS TT1]|uniref:hypothetical protein n=1 Tax=unclassified Saccharothrix TaxID=2593673 RepID=UPI00345B580B
MSGVNGRSRPVWNVLTPVVALVEADTAEDARRAHRELLESQGHLVHDEGHDVFESEPLPTGDGPELSVPPRSGEARR